MATFLDCLKLDEDVKSWRCSVTSSINDAASFVSAMEEPEEDWLRQLRQSLRFLSPSKSLKAPRSATGRGSDAQAHRLCSLWAARPLSAGSC